jgi:hypothetical protein
MKHPCSKIPAHNLVLAARAFSRICKMFVDFSTGCSSDGTVNGDWEERITALIE